MSSLYPYQYSDCLPESERLHIWNDHTSGWGNGAISWTVYEEQNALYMRKRTLRNKNERVSDSPINRTSYASQLERLIPSVEQSRCGYPAFDAGHCGVRVHRPNSDSLERSWHDINEPDLNELKQAIAVMCEFLDQQQGPADQVVSL